MSGKKFKTVLPVKTYLFDEIIEKHPYRNGGKCLTCRLKPVCSQASQYLPLMVLGEAEPRMKHRCPMGMDMLVYEVLPYTGGPDPLKEGKAAPSKARETKRKKDTYLLDANVFIHLINRDEKYERISRWVLTTPKIRKATTYGVLHEIHDLDKDLLEKIDELYPAGHIDPRLMNLKPSYGKKEASVTDLSLIQAAIEHEEVRGIITFDTDFRNIAAAGMIEMLSGRKVEILTPFQLKKKIVKPSRRQK